MTGAVVADERLPGLFIEHLSIHSFCAQTEIADASLRETPQTTHATLADRFEINTRKSRNKRRNRFFCAFLVSHNLHAPFPFIFSFLFL
ncbi:hypothetical protein G7K_1568-t1 [Saitoella complicata NRRL Y-17804]|uniref:Uncharacterized protein n=1 Tax=Saitoella complicata (strain BCRC 22490 / CBS 7301 / JCM 7358 / NBRC 10748 / NRRL Y-17804) TaxID=698492 RepID=A0A0E9ND91_SAICN|nr:hypothetical protein G7K_1568-t1 [Saitoella complicata NRRL Y-17804]